MIYYCNTCVKNDNCAYNSGGKYSTLCQTVNGICAMTKAYASVTCKCDYYEQDDRNMSSETNCD